MKVKYHLNHEGEFIIENYNRAKPFASFFPGIAGKYGIPMWVFYVNRGQAIASFGTRDKDHAILEFFPANKSWQFTSILGFRTFIKESSGKKTILYEPFHNGFANLGFDLKNRMLIAPYGLKLQEENLSLGLEVKVEYFNIPGDSYAALARIISVKNTGRLKKNIQLLDGLPQVVPYGTNNFFLKEMGRTIEAWMTVENLDKNLPFYKLSVDPADRPEVVHIKEGNFYLSFNYDSKNKPGIIKPIVDPKSVFGSATDFTCPLNFISKKVFRPQMKEMPQNKMPCAFCLLDLELAAGEEKILYSLIGQMRNKELLNSSAIRIAAPEYLVQKREENKKNIQDLCLDIDTESSSREFNLYAKQTYLDNIMRGGYPLVFGSDNNRKVFYLYSRKHGDLERDYNKFQIQPTYFSQGNGNYRDINQNRRCDVWFNPEIKDDNIIAFFNLIQADGFNPLILKGSTFSLKESQDTANILEDITKEKDIPKLSSFLKHPFTPGEIILFIQENSLGLKVSYDDFLNRLLPHCLKQQESEHGEGFWTDHWTYNLDLLEAYLGVYPEDLEEIVFKKRAFTFYDNAEIVKPRDEKYVLKNGHVRQLHSLHSDSAKKEMLKKRTEAPHQARAQYGKGQIYLTTLINKLLCLISNKLASLDPFGCGIEMEADKPNWFDALNGLPGLLGSSSCETMELKRLILFIRNTLESTKVESLSITEEISNFLSGLNTALHENLNSSSPDKDYKYWDESSTLKENYRKLTRLGFSGNEIERQTQEVSSILNNALAKVDAAIDKAYDQKTHLFYTYFINEATEYQPLKEHFVKPTKFTQKKLPFFLASQMHALRIADSCQRSAQLYKATRKSELFDKKLKMYKVTAPLKSMPEEIGRCRVFTPGWLENESIWLHMEYKYLLELLKCGLDKEFYQDFKNTLVPFLDPQRYGRNILENSSFLVSSAFPDKELHGNGFVARLSGSTVEFLQMWLVVNAGLRPFFLNNKRELNIRLSPVLPAWLFNRKDKTYTFNFLSKIKVTYHNPKLKNSFGENAAAVKKINFTDEKHHPVEILSDIIPSPYAQQIRARQIKQIDIYLE